MMQKNIALWKGLKILQCSSKNFYSKYAQIYLPVVWLTSFEDILKRKRNGKNFSRKVGQ